LKKLSILSIKTSILVGLLLSILISLFIAKVYIETDNGKKLYKTFAVQRNKLTTNIANAMITPLMTFAPNEASSSLRIIMQDKKIAKIYIYDAVTDSTFIKIYVPNRYKGTLYKNYQKIFSKNKDYLGWIEITFNDLYIQKQLNEINQTINVVLTCVFIMLILIISALLEFKVFAPLKILLKQANDFKNNDFKNTYIWKNSDELSIVGKSFEEARSSISSLILQLSDKNKELNTLYITDKLTGIYNRHKLDITLAHEENMAKRYNHNFGVILLDIDNFKSVNDIYGHLQGDKVLINLAMILKENIRITDTLGRWGGEEFLIIVSKTNKQDLLELSKKLKNLIANYDFGFDRQVTASFGLALYEEDLVTLLKKADDALYKIKNNGKNNICLYG